MASSNLAADPLLSGATSVDGQLMLGGVAIEARIGRGGMGVVYRGTHQRLGINVAIKVMAPPLTAGEEQTTEMVGRFLREARVAASISHENLVRVIDVDSAGDTYFLVMDFIDGESAAERLSRRGKLDEVGAVAIALDSARGLAAAHRRGIVHRDVKPANLLIGCDGMVRVADLGLARIAWGEHGAAGHGELTTTQSAIGTPRYMPPEQFVSARKVGPPADVWSLGVTLFQLLTAQVPWEADSIFVLANKIQNDPPRDLRDLEPHVSQRVEAIVERCLHKAPEQRYQDCGELADVLADALSEASPEDRRASRSSRISRSSGMPNLVDPTPQFDDSPTVPQDASPVRVPRSVGFGQRFGATLIDLVVLALPILLTTGMAADLFKTGNLPAGRFVGLVQACLVLGYGLWEAITGAAVGKRMIGLRVATAIDATVARRPGYIRWLAKFGGLIPFYLGLLWQREGLQLLGMLWCFIVAGGCLLTLGATRRALHDRISKTAVYRRSDVRRGPPGKGAPESSSARP